MAGFLPRLVRRDQLAAQLPRYAAMSPTVSPRAADSLEVPPGFHRISSASTLPAGSLDAAVEAILTMAMHRESGLLTVMPAERVRVGDTVIVGVPVGPLALVVPCRVGWVDETGFGYATLPGHPESGEETFRARTQLGGSVSFDVGGYSRPAGISRLGAPVARLAASLTIKRYLAAMTKLAAAG